jgi:hypothetical protein
MKTDFAPCSGYLIILKEGSEGAFIVPEPSPGDFVHAHTGLCEIIRLPDLQRYAGGQWVQIGPGVLAKPDDADRSEAFHLPGDFPLMESERCPIR